MHYKYKKYSNKKRETNCCIFGHSPVCFSKLSGVFVTLQQRDNLLRLFCLLYKKNALFMYRVANLPRFFVLFVSKNVPAAPRPPVILAKC